MWIVSVRVFRGKVSRWFFKILTVESFNKLGRKKNSVDSINTVCFDYQVLVLADIQELFVQMQNLSYNIATWVGKGMLKDT